VKIAVLSGKGGTGKTTISVNLFSYLNQAVLIDTDTEEPNAHLFLHGALTNKTDVIKHHPQVDIEHCQFCGKCGEVCNFNAIIPTKKSVLVFDDLCHDCGFCQLVCPNDAIDYVPKAIGTIEEYTINEHKRYYSGILHVGEVSGVRIIEGLKTITEEDSPVIIDCPPGVSCSTVEALQGVDHAIIVAEPTPFGISDMKMVVELLREEMVPFGVVVNKSGIGNNDIYTYLEQEQILHIVDIPFSKKRAKHYSHGQLLIEEDPKYEVYMKQIVDALGGLKE
jgi:MinD superfamily P-loop ATPase